MTGSRMNVKFFSFKRMETFEKCCFATVSYKEGKCRKMTLY